MQRDVSMLHACLVKIVAHNNSNSIDAVAIRRRGPGKIQWRENAMLVKKAVAVARCVSKTAHDKTKRVDAERL